MDIDEKYMNEALREARIALEEGEIPIGAVVVCKGRIVGKGHNMTERLHDPTAHAEMIAITAATESVGGKYITTALCTLRSNPVQCVQELWDGHKQEGLFTEPWIPGGGIRCSPLPCSTLAQRLVQGSWQKNAASL